jgi:uncharacterized protein with HEPN domain
VPSSEEPQGEAPEIPWRNIAGIGNILRHAYPIVDDSLVWAVVVRDLPPLKAVIEQIVHEANAGKTGEMRRSGSRSATTSTVWPATA